MGIEHVHIIQIHSPQTLVQTCHKRLAATPIAIRAGPHVVSGLRGHKQLVTIRAERLLHDLSESLLRAAVRRAIVVCQVKMRDAVVESIMCHGKRIGKRIHVTKIMPHPQGYFGQQHTAPSTTAITHAAIITCSRRGINRIYHGLSFFEMTFAYKNK